MVDSGCQETWISFNLYDILYYYTGKLAMKKVIDFDISIHNNRNIVLHTIRHQLYPEEEFPIRFFPDLPTVLLSCFMTEIKSCEEFRDLYRKSGDKKKIAALAREILVFKNLLENHPKTVVLMYRTSVKKFVRYKHANPDEWEDIFQEVMTRLISEKIYRIRDKFDFTYKYKNLIKKSFFTSYFMVTVRNIYMDIIRELKVRPLTAGEIQPIDGNDVLKTNLYEDKNMLNHLVIDEEFQKFHSLLDLYHKGRWKLELCLKLKSRVPIIENDINCCFPGCSKDDIKILAQNFKGVKDKKLFDKVTPVFNRNEGRENKSDTLRKWISIKIDEIISHLNRTHRCTVYTGKNVLDFMTLYYERMDLSKAGSSSEPRAPRPGK